MGITRTQLIQKVRRRLGEPMVKVEVCNEQITDNIDYARQKYIKWAIGNTTQEVCFTLLLQAGKRFYDLPAGVTEVIQYMDDPIKSGGINTLFTIDNFLFTGGFFGNLFMGGYDIVSYHIVMDFLTTLSKYRCTPYNWKYHKSTNQIEINPVPAAGKSPKPVVMNNPDTGIPEVYYIDSPGWVLIRAFMIQGSTLPSYTPDWRDILKEKKNIIEQRTLTGSEIFNRRLLLDHTPYDNTEQEDLIDSNIKEDVSISLAGITLEKDKHWWFHETNKRLIQWGDDMAALITGEGQPINIMYPVVYNSEYYPDEWVNVTETTNEVEQYIITQDNIDRGYIYVNKPIWDNNVNVSVNGYDLTLGVDFIIDPYNNKSIIWKDKNYNNAAQLDDVMTINYVSVTSMKPSNAGSNVQTVVKQYTTKIENRQLTADEATNKQIQLENVVSVGDGTKVSVKGVNKIYGVDYIILGDRRTIDWNVVGSTISATTGDSIIVTYTSATPIMSEVEEDLYESDWILDYVTALTKINLGIIRRKFASFSSMGNSGISLDGSELISEGQSEKEYLEQTLRDEECYEGLGIMTGLF